MLSISWVLWRHGLDDLLLATHLFRPLRFVRVLMPWLWFPRDRGTRGARIRRALEELGPIYIKFGQILSTRRDLLPEDIADELNRLQDRVPPFPGSQARGIIEQSFGLPVTELFAAFDETPLASASIAQVHSARLHDGREVVVKVVRPSIRPVIRRDLLLLYNLADKVERFWPDGRRLRPQEVVAEFEKTILDELDLLREAANASQLRRNFENSEQLYVPEINWPLTRRNVLVMERVSGIPIGDIPALRAAGIDLKALGETGVEIFFTQVFRDGFFHADMHPGNIFVSPQGSYIAVDFGIMGTLGAGDQRYLAQNFLAFFNRDYRRVAELHVESGWVPEDTRVEEFESAIRTVCEPIFDRPLSEISFGQLLLRLFQTARRFNMEVQPQLVLLQKTLLNIEGLGRQLYPELDLWTTAKPFLERWIADQFGPRAVMRELREQAPYWLEQLPQLPKLVHEVLRDTHAGRHQPSRQRQELEKLRRDLMRANRRLFGAVTGGALLISGAVVTGLNGGGGLVLGSIPLLGWLLGGAGVLAVAMNWPSRRQ